MSARILVVEDDNALLAILESSVALGGYESVGLQRGLEAIETLRTEAFDAVLLDLGLPDIDGEDLLRAMRAVSDVPIIVVSGRDSERDMIQALDLGADDYLPKPFLPGELLARIRAALRRYASGEPVATATEEENGAVRIGSLVLDPRYRRATLNGESAVFSDTEYKILKTLIDNRIAPVSKDAFLHALYGPGDVRTTKVVEVILGRVRHKLMAMSGGIDLIETRRGLGWALRIPS